MTSKHQQRRGLGRGLGSLIPTAPPTQPASTPRFPAAPEHAEDGQTDQSATGADAASPAGAEAFSQVSGPVTAPDATYGSGNGSAPGRPGESAGSGDGDTAAGQNGSSAPTAGSVTTDSGGTDGGASSGTGVDTPSEAGDATSGRAGTDDGSGLVPVAGAYFAELPVTQISPNPRQPRQVFEEEAMAELVHSVREIGLLQPVVVRQTGDGAYELIMGERRWRATQEAGLETIPAIVRDTGDDALLRDALLENLHRSQLNPLEEAAAYEQLLDDFGCTHEELATRIGRSRPQISNTLRLLRLSPAVQRRVAAGVLSAGHARALLAVTDSDVQDRLAARVIAEGISVRGLEEIVAVGEYGKDRPRARARKPHAPALADLASRLSDRFETRVKVDLGKSKGKITVEFASIPDLERIVSILDPKNDRPI
ncbi:ParB/RepB/Spo0J family partition protein [Nocardioides sp. WL0053]|uniref:ParB/RepB/Spo0J family partition protein n=1 Tax=Nocardioides jiangsuensis TaxID=2866161 RepID=A0ABS7RGK7_9ACTN|nr:ParB/RepB/Spo0J family partition protein [Nocardioides jiangsuensis]